MNAKEQMRAMLRELETKAERAMQYMQKVVRDFEETGTSQSWLSGLGKQDATPYDRMWTHLTKTRTFAEENGFSGAAKCLILGVLRDSTMAKIIQREYDEAQAMIKAKVKAGHNPNDFAGEFTAKGLKAEIDHCMEKILEARRATRALDE